MPDDKSKTDNRDRSRVAGGEDYEIEYLAEKAGMTREKARELVKRYGNDRETLMKHARNLV
jgi:glycerol-3-phosphate dehydrogenase